MSSKIKIENWKNLTTDEILYKFNIKADKGLTEQQVVQNRELYGSNTLTDVKTKIIWNLIIEGIKEPGVKNYKNRK